MNRDEIQKKINMLVEVSNHCNVQFVMFSKLQYKKNPGENIEVLRFLCICNMLATACEGKCRFAEDMCQDIFTLDDLIRLVGQVIMKYNYVLFINSSKLKDMQ